MSRFYVEILNDLTVECTKGTKQTSGAHTSRTHHAWASEKYLSQPPKAPAEHQTIHMAFHD